MSAAIGIWLLIGRQRWRVLSALMGISGGVLTNMTMLMLGRSIHQAVATSAGLGVFIAILVAGDR